MPYMNIFSYTSPPVRKLLGWKQGGDEEKWAEKAVASLVKKLQKKKTAISDLEFALENPGLPSNCVTIPRSQDGRLQVSHRKNLPHVIYCQVWRWPDLNSQHELKPIEKCRYSFYSKEKEVCINPYHYKRVEMSGSFGRCQDDLCSLSPTSQISANELPLVGLNLNNICNGSPPVDPRPFSCISNDSESPSLCVDDYNRHTSRMKRSEIPRPMTEKKKIWCSVSYYELNSRVGETHHISAPTVYICGYSDKTMIGLGSEEEVVCLGAYSNVNRNSTIDNTRRGIGKGIKLSIDSSFYRSIKVRCESSNAIFVQSRCYNLRNYPPTTVCRVPTECEMEVFNGDIFRKSLNAAKGDFDILHDITKMCSIRVSFVKGWGMNYRRQDITSTPCWIEILFHGPLAELDQVMRHAEAPSAKMSSKT